MEETKNKIIYESLSTEEKIIRNLESINKNVRFFAWILIVCFGIIGLWALYIWINAIPK